MDDYSNLSDDELRSAIAAEEASIGAIPASVPTEDRPLDEMSDDELAAAIADEERRLRGGSADESAMAETAGETAPSATQGSDGYGFFGRQRDQMAAQRGNRALDGGLGAAEAVMEGVAPFQRGIQEGISRDETKNKGAFLDGTAWSDAIGRHGDEPDESLRGYKAKEFGAVGTGVRQFGHELSAQAANMPFFIGEAVKGVRGLARRTYNNRATDVLIDYARDAGFDDADIEKAKEYSQGDPKKMHDFFRDAAETELRQDSRVKAAAQQRLSENEEGLGSKIVGGALGMIPMIEEFALGGAAGKALEGATGYAKLLKALPNNWKGRLARGLLSDMGEVGVLGTEFSRRRYGELTADEYAEDEDGNLVKKEGDSAGRALAKSLPGGFGEAAIFAKLGKFGQGLTPAITKLLRTKAGNAVANTYANYVKYGNMTGLRGQPKMLALMDLNAFKDEVMGLGMKDEDYKGFDAEWKRFTDGEDLPDGTHVPGVLSLEGQGDMFMSALGVMLLQGGAAGANAWRSGKAQKLSYDRRLRSAFEIPQETLDGMHPEVKKMLVRVADRMYEGEDALGGGKAREVRIEQSKGKNQKGEKYGTVRDADGNVVSDGSFRDRLMRWYEKGGKRLGEEAKRQFDEAAKYALKFDNSYGWEKDVYPGQFASGFKVPSRGVRGKDGRLAGYDVAWDDTEIPIGEGRTVRGQVFTDPETDISVMRYLQADPKGGDNGYVYLVQDGEGHRATRFGQKDAIDAANAMSSLGNRNRSMRNAKAETLGKLRDSVKAFQGVEFVPAKTGEQFDAVLSQFEGKPVSTGRGTRGVTLPDGRVMLCLDRIETPQQMKDVMLHEVGRHKGLDLVFEGNPSGKAGFVVGLARNGDPVVQNQLRVIADNMVALGKIDKPADIFKRDKDGNYLYANKLEEVYAHLFDRGDVPDEPGWWDEHMVKLRQNVRKVFRGLSYSRAEAEAMYRGAMDRLAEKTGGEIFYELEREAPEQRDFSGSEAERLQADVDAARRRTPVRRAGFKAAEKELAEEMGAGHEEAVKKEGDREQSTLSAQNKAAQKAEDEAYEEAERQRMEREAQEERDAQDEAELQRLIDAEERETDMAKREEYQRRRREITERRAREKAEASEQERNRQDRVLSAIDRAKEAERLDKKRKLAKAAEVADHERRLREAEEANDLAAYRAEEERWAEANRLADEKRDQDYFDRNQGRIEEERARMAAEAKQEKPNEAGNGTDEAQPQPEQGAGGQAEPEVAGSGSGAAQGAEAQTADVVEPKPKAKTKRGDNLRGYSYEDYGADPDGGGTGDQMGAALLRWVRDSGGLLKMPPKGAADPMADWIRAFLDGGAKKSRQGDYVALFGMKPRTGANDAMAESMPDGLKQYVENMIEREGPQAVADWFLDVRQKYSEWAANKRNAAREEKAVAKERAEEAEALESFNFDELAAARDAMDAEFADALGVVEGADEADYATLSPSSLRSARAGDTIRFDHDARAFNFGSFDAERGVLTVYDEEAAGREGEKFRRVYRVTENSIEEIDDGNGQGHEGRADADRAGNEEGAAGGRGEGQGGGSGRSGEGFSLEAATPEQLAAEKERQKQRDAIRKGLEALIKGSGPIDVQPEFDLGQTGQGDLFAPVVENKGDAPAAPEPPENGSRSAPQGAGATTPPKAEKPVEGRKSGDTEAKAAKQATWTDRGGTTHVLDGFDAPSSDNVAKGAHVAIRHDNGVLYQGEIVGIGPKNVKVRTDGGMYGGETVLTFPRKDIVGVKRTVEPTRQAPEEVVVGSKEAAKYRNTFEEGRRFVERHSGRVTEQRMIDPKSVLNGLDKNADWVRGNLLEGETWEHVVNMPTTQKYIQMYKDGSLPPPVSVIVTDSGRLRSLDRRRIVAAIEAGVTRIPANVETGERIKTSAYTPEESAQASPSRVADLTAKAESLAAEYAALSPSEQTDEKGMDLERRINEAWKAVVEAEGGEIADGEAEPAAAREESAPAKETPDRAEPSPVAVTPEMKERGIAAMRTLKGDAAKPTEELRKMLAVAERQSGATAERRAKALRDLIEYKEAVAEQPEKEGGYYRGTARFFDADEEAKEREKQYRDWLGKYRLADSEKNRREWERKNPIQEKQTALSGDTSLNQNPSGNVYAQKHGLFKPGTRNIDIGAGKFDKATQFLREQGVENIPYDPVNRDAETNRRAAESVRENPADTATVHNVLNVIDNDAVMEGIVNQAARAIKKDGTAIFTIYEGDRSGNGRATTKGYQRNAKASAYVPVLEKYFGEVETHGNVITARQPKDVGPAFWAEDSSFDRGLRFFNIDESAARRVHARGQDEARRMEGAGAGRREIWEKTGWWKGKDGKWRYEIKGISDADTRKMLDFAYSSGKFYDRDRANVYTFTFSELEKAMRERGEKLPDSVKTLIAAYPKLASEKIEVDRMAEQPAGVLGYATSGGGKGTIHLYERGATAETLNHELQHRIQERSGMAGGTNTNGKSFDRYAHEHGEWEARQAATRAGMSDAERAGTAPWETADRHGVEEDATQIDDRNRARIRPDGEPEEPEPPAPFMQDEGGGLIDKAKRVMRKAKTELIDREEPVRQMEIGAGKRGKKDLFREGSPYNALRLLPGKQEAAKKRFEDTWKKPYMQMIRKYGVTDDDVGMYGIAMNAKDRNRKLTERGGVLDGAGLSDADADKMLADLRRHLGDRKFDAIKDVIFPHLWKMQKEGLKRRVASGRVSEAVANKWEADEPHHVPMRDDLSSEDGSYNRSTRQWTKNDYREANGRYTLPDNPVEFMFMEYQDAMYGANANEARRALADFVRSTPGIGKISRGIRYGRNGAPDMSWREQTTRGGVGRPNLVAFKENGDLYMIELNGKLGEQVAEAVTGRGVRQAWKPYQSAMRAYASTATELSPAFGLRNAIADYLEASLNTMADKGLIKGGASAVKNAVNIIRMWPTIMRWLKTGEYRGAFADTMRRYVDSGALIGGMGNEGFSEIKAEAEKVSSGKKSVGDMIHLVMRPIELWNKRIELGTRLAVFKDYIDGGASDGEAAMRSREYSTDFNKYGKQRWMNSVWMFSGSVIGGAVRQTASLARSDAGRRLATGLVAYGILEAMAEHYFNEDEDEEARKSGKPSGATMSEFQRANSLYFRNGDKLIRLPFHAGPFSVLKYAGNVIARCALGDMGKDDALLNLGKEASSIGMHFTGTGDFNWDTKMQSFAPTLFVPFIQAKGNEDFAGRPIEKRMYSETKPYSENGRKGTGEVWKDIARGVNAMSGGSDRRRGMFDASPEMYKHWFDALGKNLTRDISSVVDFVTDLKDGKSVGDIAEENTRHILGYGDVVRNVPDNTQNFYEAERRYMADRADGTIRQGSRRDEAVKKLLREIKTLRHWEDGEEKVGNRWVKRRNPSEATKKKHKKLRLRYQQRVINLMEK